MLRVSDLYVCLVQGSGVLVGRLAPQGTEGHRFVRSVPFGGGGGGVF